MTYSGRCQCGAICYQLAGEPKQVSLCHCADCRRSSGAPVMAWAEYAEDDVTLSQGAPKTINSSDAAMRSFCPDCGTGLFYRNQELLPGLVEVQLATLDDAGKLAALRSVSPPCPHVAVARRITRTR